MLQDQPFFILAAIGVLAAVLGALWSRRTRNAVERRKLDEALSSGNTRGPSRDR